MRKGGGKAKGAAFERKVCKGLSQWVSGGERDDLFWRSAMSGGRATVGHKTQGRTRVAQAGDISSVDPEGNVLTDIFCIECKSVKNLAIKAALFEGVGLLGSFWRTQCTNAATHKRMPMLIAKENLGTTMLIVPAAPFVTPYGTPVFASKHLLFRSHVLDFDAYDYDAVIRGKFPKMPAVILELTSSYLIRIGAAMPTGPKTKRKTL